MKYKVLGKCAVIVVTTFILAAFTACGGGDDNGPTPSPPITTSPKISLSRTAISFTALTGQVAPDEQFNIWNSGEGTLDYSISDDATWLTINPTAGTSTGELDTITATASCVSLPKNTYNATVTIIDNNASNSPQSITVTLDCTDILKPTISHSPTSFSFTALEGQTPASQTLSISNSAGNGTTLSYLITDNATWLTINPTSGTSTGEIDSISVTASCSGLSANTYNGIITISDSNATNNPQTSSVTLTCTPPAIPIISRSPTSFSFTGEAGQAGYTPDTPKTLSVSNSGGGTLNYSITDNATWLSTSPTTGSSTGEVDPILVRASCSSLSSGTYNATITISDPSASNSPQTSSVTLTCNPPPCPSLDTDLSSPANVSTCQSLTPFFDWLDTPNAGYYNFQICRNEPCYFASPDIVYDNTNVTGSSFNLPSGILTSPSDYYWRVRAGKSGCPWSSWTEPFQFVFSTNCSGCPIGDGDLLSPADGSTGLSLTPSFDWYDVTYAGYYQLQICANNPCFAGSPDIVYSNSSITNSSFTLPSGNLNPGTFYYWRVRPSASGCPWASWSEPSQFSFTTQ